MFMLHHIDNSCDMADADALPALQLSSGGAKDLDIDGSI
jgi:hypothetical protein